MPFLCRSFSFLRLLPGQPHLSVSIIDRYSADSSVGSSGASALDRGSRSKARGSSVRSGPIRTPTDAGEDPQRGPQGRERGPWEPPAGVRQTEDALTVSCNATPPSTPGRGRRRSEDAPRRGDLIAVPIVARPLGARRPAFPRLVVPAGTSGAPQPSAPASSPAPRGATRSGRTARAQASSGPDDRRFGRGGAGMRWLRRVFGWHAPTSGVQPPSGQGRPGATIWCQIRPRTQHLAIGHALPREGLSWHRTLDRTGAGRGG